MSALSIAVVEDDAITLEMITTALENRLGATVFAFDNSKAARDFLLQQTEASIDLVISDHHMPEYDGLTLLKTCIASSLNVPFLLVTSEASRDMVISAKKLGASGFLAKPVNMAELANKVLEITAGS
ncbi:response regulator [Alteromonas sp. H39]|uniref:response regulator n=1 Tax=Alteromonas sp. H39 TaxID=3389876 RepID=UPI0039E0E9F0